MVWALFWGGLGGEFGWAGGSVEAGCGHFLGAGGLGGFRGGFSGLWHRVSISFYLGYY